MEKQSPSLGKGLAGFKWLQNKGLFVVINHNKVTRTEFKVQFKFHIANLTANSNFYHQ